MASPTKKTKADKPPTEVEGISANQPVEVGYKTNKFDFTGVDLAKWLCSFSRRTRRNSIVQGCRLASEEITKLRGEVEELNTVFDLTWKANQRAIEMWRLAHPGSDLKSPDQTKLVSWLIEHLAANRAEVAAWRSVPKYQFNSVFRTPTMSGKAHTPELEALHQAMLEVDKLNQQDQNSNTQPPSV